MADSDVIATHDVKVTCKDCKKRVSVKMVAKLVVSIQAEPARHCKAALLSAGCGIAKEDLEAFVTKMRDGMHERGLVGPDSKLDATDAWKKLSS